MKTKLYLLTGFLGSGKTTILRQLLTDLSDEKVAVIMNEFGKVGIDGPRIQSENMEMIEINQGSIFCSCLQLDFVSALVEIADKDMSYVFVESSGLADPSNIGEFLEAVEVAKGDIYEYAGAICLVDGENFLEQVNDIETVKRQLQFCHVAVISKVDIIEDALVEQVKETIMTINPHVKIITAINGKMSEDILQEQLVTSEWQSDETTNSPDTKPKTLVLTCENTINKKQLTGFINQIKQDCYRMKGVFRLKEGWHQVDVVNKRIDFKHIEPEKETSELVIISRVGNQLIRPLFTAWEQEVGTKVKVR